MNRNAEEVKNWRIQLEGCRVKSIVKKTKTRYWSINMRNCQLNTRIMLDLWNIHQLNMVTTLS